MPLSVFGPATRDWFARSFAEPTPVQARGWPAIAERRHALLLAPTGSGKTLAAFLACLDRLSRLPADAPAGVRVVYVSPLKALVYDVERNLRAPLVGLERAAEAAGLPFRPIRIDVRTGDTPSAARRAQAREPADILVTTPESLFLLLASQARENLVGVETIIVDEIHAVAGTKRGVHLALTLERLAAGCAVDPQRIGLSATQRPLSEIARFLGGAGREVEIVDASAPKELDLQIVVPAADMTVPVVRGGTAPKREDSIWPTIHGPLLELVRSHRSTLIFTNSRGLCERLAQALNALAGEELVRAHHGSVSRAQREEIEEALKAGRLPALVATSSLELGIDMGAVDLVVQVASPGSVARGLQRVGRAGHAVGEKSVGRIFPKFRGDLLECAVVARAMRAGRIEETRVPRNCLDVLAQHVVSLAAARPWKVDELEALVRRAWPYEGLTRGALEATLDLLAGSFPLEDGEALPARIRWDRATDTIEARKGAGTLARLNAGTIPDRGLFGVHLGVGGPRLGELDEEMVFESRRGDRIILGASTWRIDEITRDRVIVSPAPGEPGRLPFFKGDRPGRPVELGRELGAFARAVADLPEKAAHAFLAEETDLDARGRANLVAYVHGQREATGVVPSDSTLVVERFRDELGDWRVCVHSLFGARVNAAWALAVDAALSERAGYAAQTLWTDDGLVFRTGDEEPPPLEALLPDPDEVEDLVVGQLRHAAVFASRFREIAGRALLLPKQRPGRRTPLWAQRLRAQNLLAAVSGFPTFPLLLETYREVLQDVLDLPALIEVLRAVRRREIRVEEVETATPSPFAKSLVFAYVAEYLYDADTPLAERRAQALTLDRGLLRELLGQEELRDLLDADAIAAVEAELQALAPERRATHPDAAHDLLRRLGHLDEAGVAARCDGPAAEWLARLERERRACRTHVGGPVWIAAEDAGRYRDAIGAVPSGGLPAAFLAPVDAALESLLLRYARTHGPFVASGPAAWLGLPAAVVEAVLRALEARGRLLRSAFLPGGRTHEYCDPEILRRIKRRSLAKLRDEIAPVDGAALARFLAGWQGLGARAGRLLEVVAQLEGLALPFSALEADILPARVPGYHPRLLDELGAMGAVVWVGRGALGAQDGRVALYRRERVPLLVDAPELTPESAAQAAILDRLGARGASFFVELQVGAPGATTAELVSAVWDLVWAGALTNDTFAPLRELKKRVKKGGVAAKASGGRWALVSSLVGAAPSETERAHARAALLLDRYGVVSREAADADDLPGGFSAVYPVFRAMEDAGRVRRGWFVEGLAGAQFARSLAVDALRAPAHAAGAPRAAEATASAGDVRVLSAVDPASPWGSLLPWPRPGPRRVPGAHVVLVDGAPALYVSGKSALTFHEDDAALGQALTAWAARAGRYTTVALEKIDGAPAARSDRAHVFFRAGFARDHEKLLKSSG